MVMQINGTSTPNLPPSGLAERQLSVEMGSTPPKLWVGVPTTIDPSGRLQLLPQDLSAYVTSTVLTTTLAGYVTSAALTTALAGYLPLVGGVVTNNAAGVTALTVNATGAGSTVARFGGSTGDVYVWQDGAGLYASNPTYGPYLILARSRPSNGAVQTGDELGSIHIGGTPNSSFNNQALSCGIEGFATENWTATARGSHLSFLITANGANTPQEAAVLDVVSNGTEWHLNSNNVGGILSAFNSGDIGIVPSGNNALATWWNGTTGDIFTSADINAGNFPSERRLKKDIAPYERGLAAVMAINPVQWHWNGEEGTRDDGTMHYGIMADELEQVAPEAVVERDRMWGPGPDQRALTKGVEDRVVLTLLVNAVKELAARLPPAAPQ